MEQDDRFPLIQGNILELNCNNYIIKEEIGKGTSSIVYLAEDCSNSRLVLIKELKSRYFQKYGQLTCHTGKLKR